MNKKSTNKLVVTLNFILIILTFIFGIFQGSLYHNPCFISINYEIKSVFNNYFVDLLANNNAVILLIYVIIGIFNIIFAIQNKKNKKILFWSLILGIHLISVAYYLLNYNKYIDIILYGIVPIILLIVNIITRCKRRIKIKRINILLYTLVIIFSILCIIAEIGFYWQIIIIIMQFIYVFKQPNDVVETKKRRITNIILYYIIQLFFTIIFSVIIISLFLITKINEVKWSNDINEICNAITDLDGINNDELYIPVKKNGKYGYINEKGEEKIECQYDKITYFITARINHKRCYYALVKINDNYFIISKDNDKINVSENQYLKNIEKIVYNASGDNEKTRIFSNVFLEFFRVDNDIKINTQEFENISYGNEIKLIEKDSKFYLNNYNYTMILENVIDDNEEIFKNKYKVTIKKKNGEENSNIEILNCIGWMMNSITTYTDGSIGYESLDGKIKGFYDINGDRIQISRKSSNYEIIDVKDNKIILYTYDEKINYYIYDLTGKLLLKADNIKILDDKYLIKNEDDTLLYDKNLNIISEKYEKIIPNSSIDEEFYMIKRKE